MATFEKIDIRRSNVIAREAAILTAKELFLCGEALDEEEQFEDFLRIHSAPRHTAYALLDVKAMVLGAASVTHYHQSVSEIITLAVRSDLQRSGHGYGKFMLHGIAQEALARKNMTVRLSCYDTDILEGFYHRLGFRPSNEAMPENVAIDTLSLLNSTEGA